MGRSSFLSLLLLAVSSIVGQVQGIELNVDDPASIKSAASIVVHDLLTTYYDSKQTGAKQGLLPFPPYYWWESGAMWGGVLDYSRYTGDSGFDTMIGEGILAQASPTTDFMMWNHKSDLGNDDQIFWALTAMTAAEHHFPIPASRADQTADVWFRLARGVFQNMVDRWNTTACNGGLKWQFIPENRGFDYKSTITNVGFFQLAARLARFTGNATFADWAGKSWDWMQGVGIIDPAAGFAVYDGAGDVQNCSEVNRAQWSYNVAAAVHGAATMWNHTQDVQWRNRTAGIVAGAAGAFFTPTPAARDVMYERICEMADKCNDDQRSFKAYVARWFAKASVMCPEVAFAVRPLLRASAAGAAKSCTGEKGTTCGTKWYTGAWDGTKGPGQQMAALEVIQSLLVETGDPQVGVPGKKVEEAAPLRAMLMNA